MEREFNLLREPWLLIQDAEMHTREVSLMDVFQNAHNYLFLAGETEQQNIAVLRLLVAISYSVFGRTEKVQNTDDAIDVWKEIWEQKRFPFDNIQKYLTLYEDRFFLFDEAHPFFQNPHDKQGTWNKASKLNGAISESRNKPRMFAERAGVEKERLSYAEAARWLLFLNAFDDSAGKAFTKGKKMPSPGVGWLGKLGLVSLEGRNLFETIMLNLTMLKNGKDAWEPIKQEEGYCAYWEIPEPCMDERREISVPQNPAALYTLQSRHIHLLRTGTYVTGYYLLGGDFFSQENAIEEQMTFWNKTEQKEKTLFYPKRHRKYIYAWREFPELAGIQESGFCPGVIAWVRLLRTIEVLPSDYIFGIRFTSVYYDSKNCSITDANSSIYYFHAFLFAQKNITEEQLTQIAEEVTQCIRYGTAIKRLADQIRKASGMSKSSNKQDPYNTESVRIQFFREVDVLFRDWMQNVNDKNLQLESFHTAVKKTVLQTGRRITEQASPSAIQGRYITENGKKIHVSSPEALNDFLYAVRFHNTNSASVK